MDDAPITEQAAKPPVPRTSDHEPLRASMASPAQVPVLIGFWPPDLPEKPSGSMATCQAAINRACAAFTEAVDSHVAFLDDDSRTEIDNLLRSREYFWKKLEPVLKTTDAARAAVQGEIAQLRATIANRCSAHDNSMRTVALEGEIRAMVRARRGPQANPGPARGLLRAGTVSRRTAVDQAGRRSLPAPRNQTGSKMPDLERTTGV
jgi:hypothetical protein